MNNFYEIHTASYWLKEKIVFGLLDHKTTGHIIVS